MCYYARELSDKRVVFKVLFWRLSDSSQRSIETMKSWYVHHCLLDEINFSSKKLSVCDSHFFSEWIKMMPKATCNFDHSDTFRQLEAWCIMLDSRGGDHIFFQLQWKKFLQITHLPPTLHRFQRWTYLEDLGKVIIKSSSKCNVAKWQWTTN